MDFDKKVEAINVDDIIPNRFQPRLAFDETELKSLSDSIKQHGVIQPLVLRKTGDKYEIIAGERRYKASCMAGLKTVPAIIMEATDQKSAEIAVVENIQRKNLSAIEEAQSYKKMLDNGLTQEELAAKIGVSQSTIANKIRLLSLSDEVQGAVLTNQISERHARSLLQIKNFEDQNLLLDKIINERLTVKQTDAEINRILNKNGAPEQNIPDIQEDIIDMDAMDIKVPSENISVDVDSIKENSTDLFEQKPQISFEDLMKKQEPVQMTKDEDVIQESPEKEIELLKKPITDTEIIDFVPSPEQNEIETLDFDIPNSSLQLPEENFDISEVEGSSEIMPISEDLPVPSASQTDKEEDKKPNLIDAINLTRTLREDLENKGFRINIEEIDFDSMYQIVIKIQKD